MKRLLSISLASILAIGLVSVLVRADAEEKIRKELKANYAKIVKGFKENDPAVWEGFLLPDFIEAVQWFSPGSLMGGGLRQE